MTKYNEKHSKTIDAKNVSTVIQEYLKTTQSEILQTFNETTFTNRVEIVNPLELKEMVSAIDTISKVDYKFLYQKYGKNVKN